MTGVARLQAFRLDPPHLRPQGEEVADRRSGHRQVAVEEPLQPDEIEVVALADALPRPFQGPRRDGADGEARRQRQTLLHRGQADVDPVLVDVDRHPSERGHGVDEERHVTMATHRLADLAKGVGDARGRLVVHQGDGVVTARRQHVGDRLGGHRSAPLDVQRVGLETAGQRDLVEPLGEGAADRHQDPSGHAVAQRRLPQGGGRAGGQEDIVGP